MMCYRDMTFCPYFHECRFGEVCHRALTDGVREAAEKAQLHICEYAETPDCFRGNN